MVYNMFKCKILLSSFFFYNGYLHLAELLFIFINLSDSPFEVGFAELVLIILLSLTWYDSSLLWLFLLSCYFLTLNISDFPCEVVFKESVDNLVEPKDFMHFPQFSIRYIDREEIISEHGIFEPRFGGHQTLEERESSFYARNQTLHCGFVKGPEGYPSTGFDLNEKDREYMDTCRIVVSSCIFGSSDFLRRPTSKKVHLTTMMSDHYPLLIRF